MAWLCAVACLLGEGVASSRRGRSHADPEMHPAIARAQAILAARALGMTRADLPEVPATDTGLRVELDPPIRVDHGASVRQNLRHGNRVSVPTRNRGATCANASAVPARTTAPSPGPDALARVGLRRSSVPRRRRSTMSGRSPIARPTAGAPARIVRLRRAGQSGRDRTPRPAPSDGPRRAGRVPALARRPPRCARSRPPTDRSSA